MNWPKAVEAFAEWENQIRRKFFFHELKKKEKKQGNEYATQEEEEDERDAGKYKRMPWYGKSDWVAPTAKPEIEQFIEKVRAALFNNQGKKI